MGQNNIARQYVYGSDVVFFDVVKNSHCCNKMCVVLPYIVCFITGIIVKRNNITIKQITQSNQLISIQNNATNYSEFEYVLSVTINIYYAKMKILLSPHLRIE